jgi:hypothetical protein
MDQPHPNTNREDPDHTRAALAMCENIDWNVGRVLAKLDELSLATNTIVIFFSDNGPNGWRWNGGMRGRKGSTDEGGVRSPLFIRWPVAIKPGTRVTQISAVTDLLPTLADLANIPLRAEKPLDGISLKPLLLGEDKAQVPRVLVSHWKGKISVRTQRHRLDHQGRLYDMVQDPGQQYDVSAQEAAIAAGLHKIARDWADEMLAGDGKAAADRPLVIGHPGSKATQIPARDGVAHGNIKRSNPFPNDSFFTHWTDPADYITWDCEIGEAGDYKVELFYTCPAADVGSTLELSFNKSRLVAEIAEAHDPPLLGMERDRVERRESYTKDFRRMTLGTMRFEEETGTLKFRALAIPGSQVMDFRLLYLTRQ